MNYYYQRLDTQDLVVPGGNGDVENNYQQLADLGMRYVHSIYCAEGRDFDQVFLKKEMKGLRFYRFFTQSIYTARNLEKFYARQHH